MSFRFLLDEQVDPQVGKHLERERHDAAHVRATEELGAGSDDADVAAHAARVDQHVLTNDDDFYEHLSSALPTVFFYPDQRLQPHEIAAIVGEIERQYPDGDFEGRRVVFVVDGWLKLQ